MRSVAVGGTYYRVADPRWGDPLDPDHAEASGQRWNPPGVACLYLNDDMATARSNIADRFAGLPYGPEDLEPAEAPVLIVVEVPAGQALDAVSDEGLAAVGLPVTYPLDSDGDVVAHSFCQPIGAAARDAGLDGVASRSAAADANSPGSRAPIRLSRPNGRAGTRC